MGRASLVVNSTELQRELTTLESSKQFTNHSDLFLELSLTSWAKDIRNTKHQIRGASPQFLQAKVRELGLKVNTPVGKRGRSENSVRTSRGSKFSKNPKIVKVIERIRKNTPDKYQKNVDQLAEGSIRAAVRLRCISCHGFTGAHRACDDSNCELLPINILMWPNRKVLVEGEDKFYHVVSDKSEKTDC